MKINKITCHKVYNHDASLQENVLLKFVNKHDNVAITKDYSLHYLTNHIFLY
jgi:hypothetical protein